MSLDFLHNLNSRDGKKEKIWKTEILQHKWFGIGHRISNSDLNWATCGSIFHLISNHFDDNLVPQWEEKCWKYFDFFFVVLFLYCGLSSAIGLLMIFHKIEIHWEINLRLPWKRYWNITTGIVLFEFIHFNRSQKTEYRLKSFPLFCCFVERWKIEIIFLLFMKTTIFTMTFNANIKSNSAI